MKLTSHLKIEERLHRIEKILFISSPDPPEGETPGIDRVLAVGEPLTAYRLFDIGIQTFQIGNSTYGSGLITINGGGGVVILGDQDGAVNGTRINIDDQNTTIEYRSVTHNIKLGTSGVLRVIEPSEGEYLLSIEKHNSFLQSIEGDTFSNIDLTANVSETAAVMQSKYDDGVITKAASIEFFANSSQATMTYTADTHAFITEGQTNLSVSLNNSSIRAFDPTGDNNIGEFFSSASSTDVIFSVMANFNDGVKLAKIEGFGDATTSTIAHTADTHTFNINGVLSAIFNGNNFLLIDPTVNDESAAIQANNITGAGNLANVRAFTDDTSAGAVLLGTFNNDKQFSISGSADASGSSLTHTADTHTFIGVLNLPTQSAPASPADGDIWRQDNTNTGLKIRINGVTKTITVS